MEIEKEFNLVIPDDEADKIKNMSDVMRFIEQQFHEIIRMNSSFKY